MPQAKGHSRTVQGLSRGWVCGLLGKGPESHTLHSMDDFWNSFDEVGLMAALAGTVATNCIRLIKLYQLSHQGSPRILERVAYPFSSDLPDQGIEPGSPALQVDSLPAELPGSPKFKL